MALQLRTKHRSITNPTLIHFFSSTSNPDTPSPPDPTTPKPQSTSSFSSHFSDVKSSLKHQTPKLTSLDEIHKNLSEFRLRSSPPSPNPVTFQELVDRKVINTSPDNGQEGKIPFAKIRESLRQMKQTSQSQPNKNNANQHTSFAIFKNNNPPSFFNDNSRNVIGGGSEGLPASIFGRESKGEKDNAMKDSMRSEFMKTYTQSELGEKLKKLRPEKEGGDWFSLKELSERLEKLREIDEKEMESSKTGSLPFAELRESLKKLHMADENEKKNKTSM